METFGRSFFTVLASSTRAQNYSRTTEHVRARSELSKRTVMSAAASVSKVSHLMRSLMDVMMFAENYISVIPSIHKIKNILELPDDIEKMLKQKVNPADLEKYIQFSEKISFKFNPLAFTQDIDDFFYFSGQLVDVKITENKMKTFFEKENDKIELLTNQYIKKMSLNN